MKTLVDAYGTAGHTNSKWDEPARRALTEFARCRSLRTEPGENWAQIIATNCAEAVALGCDDPMIQYLHIRFVLAQSNSPTAFLDVYCQTARKMNQSSYPAIRKFYAVMWAMDQIFYTYGTNCVTQPVESEIADLVNQNVDTALEDKTMPVREAYELSDKLLHLISGCDTKNYQQAYARIEKHLTDNWPGDYSIWLLKGIAQIHMAWQARGSGWANTVTDEGWKGFAQHLDLAKKALEHAWKMNPKDPEIARHMIIVTLGRSGDRAEMEKWFDRAMALNPNYYDACVQKLYFLEPKWYGSRDAMLDFGRECVANTNWGGKVPCVLIDVHLNYCNGYVDELKRTNYWKDPEVWTDIKSAYERFFQINPDAVNDYIGYYAWYAYKAEQWDVLNNLIPKLGPDSYYIFGGQAEFDKMVRSAKEHTGEPK